MSTLTTFFLFHLEVNRLGVNISVSESGRRFRSLIRTYIQFNINFKIPNILGKNIRRGEIRKTNWFKTKISLILRRLRIYY